MELTVFDFADYHSFLRTILPTRGPGRGRRVQLAAALRVQKGYVSEVLNGKADFCLEQAYEVSDFLSLADAEREFFLLLVQISRSGSKKLEAYFRRKIQATLANRREISERVLAKTRMSDRDQLTYYSAWHFTAVHMCLMVQATRTIQSISDYLNVPKERVTQALDFLIGAGLAVRRGNQFEVGATRIHLPSHSPYVARHHANWRIQALQSAEWNKQEHLHYTSIMSISSEAAQTVRDMLLKTIESTEPVIKKSGEHGVYAFMMDLFDLKGRSQA